MGRAVLWTKESANGSMAMGQLSRSTAMATTLALDKMCLLMEDSFLTVVCASVNALLDTGCPARYSRSTPKAATDTRINLCEHRCEKC